MEQEIFELIKPFLATSPLAVVAYFFYRSGFIGALASRIRKNGNDKRLTAIQDWQKVVEDNHFNDLSRLIKDVEELTKSVNKIDRRLIIVETRQSNGKFYSGNR